MQLIFHGVGHYVPGRLLRPSIWPHADIITVVEGEFTIVVRGTPFTFQEGDALTIPAHHDFHGECLSETGSIWVMHHAGFPACERSPFLPDAEPTLLGGVFRGRLEQMLLDRFTTLWRSEPLDPALLHEAELIAELLLTHAERLSFAPQHPEPPRLRVAVEAAIKGQLPGGINGSVAEMARIAGLGPSRFRQVFNEYYGISPLRYLQQLRMEEARRLLSETERPIKEVAQMTGFTELAAFHRAFRREAGITPAAYRRQCGHVA